MQVTETARSLGPGSAKALAAVLFASIGFYWLAVLAPSVLELWSIHDRWAYLGARFGYGDGFMPVDGFRAAIAAFETLLPIELALVCIAMRNRLASACVGVPEGTEGSPRIHLITIGLRGLGLYLLLAGTYELCSLLAQGWLSEHPFRRFGPADPSVWEGEAWPCLWWLFLGLLLAWPTSWLAARLRSINDL